jgi:putative pyruvate formate lyase activating enzyme
MEDSTRREFLEAGLATAQGFPTLRRKDFEPAYLRLERSGELARRVSELYSIYRSCRLCPRQCGVDRTSGEKGVCSSTSRAKVYSAHPHFGEERPLVGRGGSGTIFFSNCNLLCRYCQNWEINHRGDGSYVSDEDIGRMMTGLQAAGCHNINLVTPTHVAPNIISGLRTAIRGGLRVPLVYNCGDTSRSK